MTAPQTVFVGVICYHNAEAECCGVWTDEATAKDDIEKENHCNPEFSDRDCAQGPYWGTEEWTITLHEQQVITDVPA